MPSLFKQHDSAVLKRRREQVEREIASLIAFRDRIDRRLSVLAMRDAVVRNEAKST